MGCSWPNAYVSSLVREYIYYYLKSTENPSSGEEESIFQALAKIYNIALNSNEIQGLKLFYSPSNANDFILPKDLNQRIGTLLKIISDNPGLFESELPESSSITTFQPDAAKQAGAINLKLG